MALDDASQHYLASQVRGRRPSCDSGDAYQSAFGVGEMTDHEASRLVSRVPGSRTTTGHSRS
jgi:hypothetical protein